MAPLADGVAGAGTAFEHQRGEPAREKVGGGGEADRPGADDGNRQGAIGTGGGVGHG